MPAPWIEEGCPWYALHTWLPPDIEWCEAAQCSVISEPANTWSNLAYVFFGMAVWAWGGRSGRAWGPAMIFVGAMSFAYHASANFIGQLLDHVGMFVFAALPLTVNIDRLWPLSRGARRGVYWGLVLGTTALVLALYALGIPIQPSTALLVLSTLALEAVLAWRGQRAHSYGTLALAMGSLALALFIRELDRQRIVCDPNAALMQGHAIWHVISAASIAACWRFYRQFDVEGAGAGD